MEATESENKDKIRSTTSSDERRKRRFFSPFTLQWVDLRQDQVVNEYPDEYRQMAISLFCQRKTFEETASILQGQFPHLDVNTDKVKSMYYLHKEEYLKARDSADGILNEIQQVDDTAILHKAVTSNMTAVESLIEKRDDLLLLLGRLNPEENFKQYTALAGVIDKFDRMINSNSGMEIRKEQQKLRARAYASIQLRKMMIKEGLIKPIEGLKDVTNGPDASGHAAGNDDGIPLPNILEDSVFDQ